MSMNEIEQIVIDLENKYGGYVKLSCEKFDLLRNCMWVVWIGVKGKHYHFKSFTEIKAWCNNKD